MNNIIITGASGFLGKNLLKRFVIEDKYHIYALSSNAIKLDESFSQSGFNFCDRNIIYSGAVEELFYKSWVINCAFPRNSSGLEMASGLQYIKDVFEISAKNRAEAIINISSQSVYSSDRREPATEQTEICLDSPYAVGKFASELLLESICENYEAAYMNLRMASLIGPGFDQRIINRFIKTALEHKEINVNDSKQIFGFLDISDAVNGIFTILEDGTLRWDSTYNFGIQGGYTLREIATEINKVFEKRHIGSLDIKYTKVDNCSSSALDASAFYKRFGYLPNRTLKMSIEDIIDFYTSQISE